MNSIIADRRPALLGGKPEFDQAVPVGQLYFPDWQRYETAFRDIFRRQYYTNHGPLARDFEQRLAEFLGVRHVVCVTNATIGLMMAVKALEISGKVVVPAFTFSASAQALTWAGVEPLFCDVDPHTQQVSPETVAHAIERDDSGKVSAILGVNLWGGACRPEALQALAERKGLALFFDSAHAFGCKLGTSAIGHFGAVEVFSFHATKILGATEGGCLCTNDDRIAARLRNIRSSYGAGPAVEVPLTSNGRMSEAQAAIGLMNLDDYPANRERNRVQFEVYRRRLAGIDGIHLVEPTGVDETNYQYVVAEVDESRFGLGRDLLLKALKVENVIARRYFYPGLHRVAPYCDTLPQYVDALPVTDQLCTSSIQFPIGALTDEAMIERICDCIQALRHYAAELRTHEEKAA